MYKLGIVGFGVVGKSVLAFLNKQHVGCGREHNLFEEHTESDCLQVQVWDVRKLQAEEQNIIELYKAIQVDVNQVGLTEFIKNNDYIIASPGVDLGEYKEFSHKFLCELDFFSEFFYKPLIAITGSLGKTSITKILGKLISSLMLLPRHQKDAASAQLSQALQFSEKIKLKAVIGGNVGIGMLDLVQQQDPYDIGVLELSSFQLELSKKFTPDIAVWTNWYPNHFDRHITPENYFEAKFNVLRFAKEHQVALLAAELFATTMGKELNERLASLRSTLYLYTSGPLDLDFVSTIKRDAFYFFYTDNGWLTKATIEHGAVVASTKIVHTGHLPDITFLQNWCAIVGVLHILSIDVNNLHDFLSTHQDDLLDDHHHRVEHCGTVRGIDFYNDSKSTIMEATIAAVDRMALHKRPVILITGGLSKGVDRSDAMAKLQEHAAIKKMYCFGKECPVLAGACTYQTLEQVIQDVKKTMQAGDIVLFSPGGASYDLFKNYGHRGMVFKDLVKALASMR